jgi:Family of unknown function (DUF6221)
MRDDAAFVTAHLNLWESIAKAADPAPWKARSHPGDSGMIRDANGDILVYDEGVPSEESASHIALNDPGLVLRVVAAVRWLREELDLSYPDEQHMDEVLAAIWDPEGRRP